MSDAQIMLVCRQCMERCAAGNTWPPDLAEFVALVSASGANPFNLTSDAVMAEYKRWRNESYRYSGSDKYPWKQDVLYHICIEMRRTGVERNLTEGELKNWQKTYSRNGLNTRLTGFRFLRFVGSWQHRGIQLGRRQRRF